MILLVVIIRIHVQYKFSQLNRRFHCSESIAESMSDAMNRVDEDQARRMFDTLMNFMKESKSSGRCEMNFHNISSSEPDPSKSTFT